MVALSNAAGVGRRILSTFSEKNVTLMAAGIAYNAFVSLAPALLLLVFVVSILGGGLEARVLEAARGSLPGPIADVVAGIFEGSSAVGASFIGLVALLWGTLKVFRGLDTAFSEIYETVASNSFTDQVKDGVIVLAALGVTVVTTVSLSATFATFADEVPYIGLLTPALTVAVLTAAFLPMYYYFPDVDLEWRSVLPGVVFAAVGWALLQSLFQVYLAFKGDGSGSFLGGVVVVITWLYFSGLVLLLGAVINAVLDDRVSTATGGAGSDGAAAERTDSLDRRELAAFLRGLHDDLTANDAAGRAATADVGRYPRPDGPVEVVERSTRGDGSGREWTVRLRWRTDGPPGAAGDDGGLSAERAGPDRSDRPEDGRDAT